MAVQLPFSMYGLALPDLHAVQLSAEAGTSHALQVGWQGAHGPEDAVANPSGHVASRLPLWVEPKQRPR